jgi:hypothetical protein
MQVSVIGLDTGGGCFCRAPVAATAYLRLGFPDPARQRLDSPETESAHGAAG